MKLTHGLAAVALSLTAMAAQAEITGNAAVLSDYNWRGITQTSQDPALQGGIDYAHESGFYLGAWASNVDFGDCCDENVEIDLYTGFRGGDDDHLGRRPHLLHLSGRGRHRLRRDLRGPRLELAERQGLVLE